MSRVYYVNGRYLPLDQAVVHVEDRGFQFADGIYEVVAVFGGRFVDIAEHLDRLERSLQEIHLPSPLPRPAYPLIFKELIRQNRLRDGLIYLQVTRGYSPRAFHFPQDIQPTLVITARPYNYASAIAQSPHGVKAITTQDLRWKRCDIKSIALLASVLAKEEADEKDAFEAILVNDLGFVTEGSSSNIWIINAEGQLQTHPLTPQVLSGITRQRVLSLCQEAQIPVIEESFQREALFTAQEIFLSSATKFITPIVVVDGQPIGNGRPGPMTHRLRGLYHTYIKGLVP